MRASATLCNRNANVTSLTCPDCTIIVTLDDDTEAVEANISHVVDTDDLARSANWQRFMHVMGSRVADWLNGLHARLESESAEPYETVSIALSEAEVEHLHELFDYMKAHGTLRDRRTGFVCIHSSHPGIPSPERIASWYSNEPPTEIFPPFVA